MKTQSILPLKVTSLPQVNHYLKVSEEDDGGVGAQEDEYVPTAVQVREPDTGPELAKEPVHTMYIQKQKFGK